MENKTSLQLLPIAWVPLAALCVFVGMGCSCNTCNAARAAVTKINGQGTIMHLRVLETI